MERKVVIEGFVYYILWLWIVAKWMMVLHGIHL